MTTRDRPTQPWERENPDHPIPPTNLEVIWAFAAPMNAVDLYWDDPSQLEGHGEWNIHGVNVYRSTDSEYGPYHRLNDDPIGATFWRDATEHQQVDKEDVSDAFVAKGDTDPSGQWVFEVQHTPIVKPGSEDTPANHPADVSVFIDGTEVVPQTVDGEKGRVVLRTDTGFDPETGEQIDPVLPDPDSTVECSYKYNLHLVRNKLYQRIFYRVTTVGTREWDGELRESPLKWADPKTVHHMEDMSYIWREGIRRNQWILDQGGERVKVFLRKYMGEQCDCYDHDFENASFDCGRCFGTGIKGGYEGPYEIKVSPSDAERSIEWDERGLHQEQTEEYWTGPSPLLSQRDFLVKQNNDRYGIGPVHVPTNRGNILQQHLQVEMVDENDIRYEVPVTGTDALSYPETRVDDHGDDPTKTRNPQITEDDKTPDNIERRGRTPTYENINT